MHKSGVPPTFLFALRAAAHPAATGLTPPASNSSCFASRSFGMRFALSILPPLVEEGVSRGAIICPSHGRCASTQVVLRATVALKLPEARGRRRSAKSVQHASVQCVASLHTGRRLPVHYPGGRLPAARCTRAADPRRAGDPGRV